MNIENKNYTPLTMSVIETKSKDKKFMAKSKNAKKSICELCDKSVNLEFESYDESIKNIKDIESRIEAVFNNHNIAKKNLDNYNSILYKLTNRWLDDDIRAKNLVNGILQGIDNIESETMYNQFRDLARKIVKDSDNGSEMNLEELRNYLTTCDDKIKNQYNKFVDDFGHRAMGNYELRNVSWKNDSDAILKALAELIQSKPSKATANTFVQFYDGMISVVFPMKRKFAGRMVEKIRSSRETEEFIKSKIFVLLDQAKSAYSSLAQKLYEDSLLPDQDIIYFFKNREIVDYVINNKKDNLINAMNRREGFVETVEENSFIEEPGSSLAFSL